MGKSKELATFKDQGIETSKPIKVGKDGITNAYGDANGYVADFQADTGNQTYISIAEPNAASTGDNGLILGEDTSGSYLYQRASKSLNFGNNNLTRIKIDASGRVTMPYQPAFCVSRQTDQDITTSGSNVDFVYDQVIFNTGSHYNSSNGRFTAPVDGVYHFSINARIDYFSSTYFWIKLQLNGNSAVDGGFPNCITQQTGNYFTVSASGTVLLDANDYVNVVGYSSADADWDFENASYFSGHLVG